MLPISRLVSLALWLCSPILLLQPAIAQTKPAGEPPKVVVRSDGTIEVPPQTVPMSSFLSPEAKAYVTQHLKDMQNPEMLAQVEGVPRFMKTYIDRQRVLYAVRQEDTNIAGVHAYVYTPYADSPATNRNRILINLHGGGFSGCWPACAELESIPIAALAKTKVVSLDYREGPQYKFPAGSEDVAAVYKELLKDHAPQNIGIYGCSAGGMLTAMSVAWFQKHNLPKPAAAGIFCAGAGSPSGAGFGGDAAYTAAPLGEGRGAPPLPSSNTSSRSTATAGGLAYLAGTDPRDPLVAPINSPQ